MVKQKKIKHNSTNENLSEYPISSEQNFSKYKFKAGLQKENNQINISAQKQVKEYKLYSHSQSMKVSYGTFQLFWLFLI